MLLYLYQILMFLLGHLHFFWHYFFTFMENLFKKHPIFFWKTFWRNTLHCSHPSCCQKRAMACQCCWCMGWWHLRQIGWRICLIKVWASSSPMRALMFGWATSGAIHIPSESYRSELIRTKTREWHSVCRNILINIQHEYLNWLTLTRSFSMTLMSHNWILYYLFLKKNFALFYHLMYIRCTNCMYVVDMYRVFLKKVLHEREEKMQEKMKMV